MLNIILNAGDSWGTEQSRRLPLGAVVSLSIIISGHFTVVQGTGPRARPPRIQCFHESLHVLLANSELVSSLSHWEQ